MLVLLCFTGKATRHINHYTCTGLQYAEYGQWPALLIAFQAVADFLSTNKPPIKPSTNV